MSTPISPPDAESRGQLDLLAQNMIDEATSTDNPKIFSATGFARENISIIHQQIRATNLAWALGWTGRVKPGDTVAIVGGSFSGLTLAVILALVNDAIVLIFEKETELLARFRDSSHRHLSANLNSRALGKNFDPSLSTPEFRSPIFAWAAGRASEVAAFWAAEFRGYDEKLPIFTFRDTEVRSEMVKDRPLGLEIDLSLHEERLAAIPVDLLIDATGFGEEANPRGVTDYSYWEAGHRLIYDHLVPPARVLISGCGDSGVIEALHYAAKDFRHADVEALWPLGVRLEARIDEGLVHARLNAIFKNDEGSRFEQPVLSEVCWWLNQRYFLAYNPHISWPPSGEPWARPILEALEAALKPHYERLGSGGDIALADWDALKDFVIALPLDAQLEAREAARKLGDEWISREICDLADSIDLPPNIGVLHAMARPGVEIILNGRMPTGYTRQLSPYNVWLMRLLLSFPSVRYHQGEIASVAQRHDHRFDVTFGDGTAAIVDRAVTRYGPGPGGGAGLAQGRRRDTQGGDWLLTRPVYLGRDAQDPTSWKYVNPERANIVTALEALGQRPAKPTPDISKRIVASRILLGPNSMPSNEPIYSDPLPWLAAELKAGRHPGYGADSLVERELTHL